MSVSSLVTLPAQPGSGTTTERPLGGDGWTAPHSVHAVDVELESDASLGTSTIRVHTDPRWSCVISYMLTRLQAPTADMPIAQTIVMGKFSGFAQVTNVIDVSAAPIGISGGVLWTPPPFISSTSDPVSAAVPMYGESLMNNIDTETHTLHMRVYNFHKDAERRVPLSVLLASLPRGSNLT